jgi:arginase
VQRLPELLGVGGVGLDRDGLLVLEYVRVGLRSRDGGDAHSTREEVAGDRATNDRACQPRRPFATGSTLGLSMSEIRVVVVPYELGRLREGVGCGPERLLEFGAEDALASAGAIVRAEMIELDGRYGASGRGDVDAAFELIRLVSERVRLAREAHAFPVVLSGSCFAAVGVVAGLEEPAPGVVWFDAHGDFNEPETSTSGYFDGMGLAVLTGNAWQGLLATVPATRPLPESTVVLAGARNFDPAEETRLRSSQIVHLTSAQLRSPEALVEALQAVVPEITGLYVHLDLDVLDVEVANVNVYGAPDGLDGDQLDALLDAVMQTFPVRAVSLTAYDPACDVEGRVPPIALRLLRTIAQHLEPGE